MKSLLSIKKISSFLSAAAVFTLVSACSDARLTSHKREASFYQPLLNSSMDLPLAHEKLETLKLLDTGDSYPIRIALFDNQKFYYQVDKLGDGRGEWEYRDGALFLVAARPYFDLLLAVSAEAETGETKVIRFEDRFGLNTLKLELRDPAKLPQSSRALRSFEYSEKNI